MPLRWRGISLIFPIRLPALCTLSGQMANLSEIHGFYPILHCYSLQEGLLRTVENYAHTVRYNEHSQNRSSPPIATESDTRSSAVDQLWTASFYAMEQLSLNLLPVGCSVEKHQLPEQGIRLWERRYQRRGAAFFGEGNQDGP